MCGIPPPILQSHEVFLASADFYQQEWVVNVRLFSSFGHFYAQCDPRLIHTPTNHMLFVITWNDLSTLEIFRPTMGNQSQRKKKQLSAFTRNCTLKSTSTNLKKTHILSWKILLQQWKNLISLQKYSWICSILYTCAKNNPGESIHVNAIDIL